MTEETKDRILGTLGEVAPAKETIDALQAIKDFLLDPKNHKNENKHYYSHGFFLGLMLVDNLIAALQED